MKPGRRRGGSSAPSPPRAAAVSSDAVPLIATAVLAAALFAAYLALAPHATADEDAAEFTLVLATGGVAHPTGYPLWTLLGQAFMALLRAGGVGYAFAANAWSSTGAAVALFFLHRIVLRLLPRTPALGVGRRFTLAALPVIALALNPQWLTESTIVEIHTWHVAWVCGATLAFVRAMQALAVDARPTARHALAWGLVCGVGAAHHSMAAFYAAVYTLVLVWMLARARQLRAVHVALALAGGMIPLLSYGVLYWRTLHPGDAAIWPTLEPGLRGLVDHATGAIYRGYLGHWRPDPTQAAALAHDVYPFLWPALALSIVAVALARTPADRLTRGAIVAAVAVQVVFNYQYGVVDPVSYFLPPLALALPGVAIAVHAAMQRSRIAAGALLEQGAVTAIAGALTAWGVHSGLATRRDVEQYDANIRSMWHAVPYDRCIFLWPSDVYCKLKLYQRLEGDKPGIEVYNSTMLCNPYPASQFARTHGFDPLANNGPEHARDAIAPKYFAEQHATWDPRYVARVNETIADSARVPVLLFDGSRMRLTQLSRGRTP